MNPARFHPAPWFLPWLLLVLFSAAAHFWLLDQRPFHYDEAVHAKLAYNLVHTGEYRYDPAFHGPLLYYITSVFYLVFGDSDFVARLPSAVLGVLMLVLAYHLKRPFGMRAAWFTGLLFTISPLCLYYSRFLRMDVLEMFTATACFLCVYRAMLGGSRHHWLWAAFWGALAVATKENAYITMILAVVTGLLTAYAYESLLRPSEAWRLAARHCSWILAAAAVFVLTVVSLYTVFLRQPEDWSFAVSAVRFWTTEHDIERIAGPWWYHLFRLGVYEFLIMSAAAVWVLRRARLRRIELVLIVFGLCSLVMYAYLGEKVPWLALHQLWAFLPLAGIQLARTFGPQGSWWGRATAGIALAATVLVSYNANFLNPFLASGSGKFEAMYFAETTPELKLFAKAVVVKPGQPGTAASASGHATWPLAWYWRDRRVQWDKLDEERPPPLVVVDASRRDGLEAKLGDAYEYHDVPVRAWWFPERQVPTITEFVHYLFWREPWLPPVIVESTVGNRKR